MVHILLVNSKLCLCSTEPISSKAPTLQADNKFIRIERRIDQPMVLFCNSQAYPVPVFRFVQTHTEKERDVEWSNCGDSELITVDDSINCFAAQHKCQRNCVFLSFVLTHWHFGNHNAMNGDNANCAVRMDAQLHIVQFLANRTTTVTKLNKHCFGVAGLVLINQRTIWIQNAIWFYSIQKCIAINCVVWKKKIPQIRVHSR